MTSASQISDKKTERDEMAAIAVALGLSIKATKKLNQFDRNPECPDLRFHLNHSTTPQNIYHLAAGTIYNSSQDVFWQLDAKYNGYTATRFISADTNHDGAENTHILLVDSAKNYVLLGWSPVATQSGWQRSAAFVLTVAHVNDTHAHLESESQKLTLAGQTVYADVGGFPRLVTKVTQLREKNDHFLFLHAGDVFSGTLYFGAYKGMADQWFLEAAGLDAMAVGNHEFDAGSRTLANFVEQADFPVLSANTDTLNNADLNGKFLPYVVKEIDGERVALIGLTTPDTKTQSKMGGQADEFEFLDPVASMTKQIETLKQQGINKIIVLSHLGYAADMQLAKAVNDIDIIVGGHSHTLLGDFSEFGLQTVQPYPITVNNPDGQPVYIVQAGNYTQVLGLFDVKFDAHGNVSVRADFSEGDITLGNIYTVFPFGNTLVVVSLTGQEFYGVIEDMTASMIEAGKTTIPFYGSGLECRIDMSKPSGERVTQIKIQDGTGHLVPVERDATYKVVMQDFVAAGGDNNKTLGAIEPSRKISTGIVDAEALTDYLREQKVVDNPTENAVEFL